MPRSANLRGFRRVLDWGIASEVADLPGGSRTYLDLCGERAAWLNGVRGWESIVHRSGRYCCVVTPSDGLGYGNDEVAS